MDWMQVLLEQTGAEFEGKFVTKPGCKVIAATRMTPDAEDLVDAMYLTNTDGEYESIAELNARLTYLTFDPAPGMLKRVIDRQHLSIFGGIYVTFLIAGISVETSMELIAHSEAKVGRLTTSKTVSMCEPYYRLLGSEADQRKLRDVLTRIAKNKETDLASVELRNMVNPGLKCTTLTYTMSLKDFHKLFIGRFEPGNETEVQEICALMCEQLHKEYPLVIGTPSSYRDKGNGAKYGS